MALTSTVFAFGKLISIISRFLILCFYFLLQERKKDFILCPLLQCLLMSPFLIRNGWIFPIKTQAFEKKNKWETVIQENKHKPFDTRQSLFTKPVHIFSLDVLITNYCNISLSYPWRNITLYQTLKKKLLINFSRLWLSSENFTINCHHSNRIKKAQFLLRVFCTVTLKITILSYAALSS